MNRRIFAAALMFVLSGGGSAQAAIYLELGTSLSIEQAEQSWTALQASYPVLRSYSFYPERRTMTGKEPVYRLEAGPVANKSKAEAICRQLFAKDQECFVVEKSATLPWRDVKAEPAIAGQPVGQETTTSLSEPVLLAQKTDTPFVPISLMPSETTSEPLAVPAEEGVAIEAMQAADAGKVDVAEAIRVPLSEPPTTPMEGAFETPVQQFKNTVEQSTQLYERGPRYRSFHLIKATDRDKVLHVDDLSGHQGYPARKPKKRMPQKMAYWVHLGVAASREEAQEKWDALRRSHPKLLADKKVHIHAPASLTNARRPALRLRTGPFSTEEQAGRYCGKLQSSHVSCLVIHDF